MSSCWSLTLSKSLEHVAPHPRQAVLRRVGRGGASGRGADGHGHGAAGAVAGWGMGGSPGLRLQHKHNPDLSGRNTAVLSSLMWSIWSLRWRLKRWFLINQRAPGNPALPGPGLPPWLDQEDNTKHVRVRLHWCYRSIWQRRDRCLLPGPGWWLQARQQMASQTQSALKEGLMRGTALWEKHNTLNSFGGKKKNGI